MIRERFDALVCDLDGVVFRGNDPIEGAAEAIRALRSRGVRVLFCTNNSRSTVTQYVDKLQRVGVPARPEDVLTSAVVMSDVLEGRGARGKTAYVVGGEGIREALAAAGVEPVDGDGPVDFVVVGWDPGFDYVAMRRASKAVRGGATLMATNSDAAFPAPDGLWPGAGAILASIEVASGAVAEVMGKPNPPMLDSIARRLDAVRRIAVVGDRPETDLAGARTRGWTTILVLTGVTSEEEAPSVEPRPDFVVPSLADLV